MRQMLPLPNRIAELITRLKLKKYRDQEKRYVVEGRKLVLECLRDRPQDVECVVACDSELAWLEGNQIIPAEKAFIGQQKTFSRLSTLDTPPGILAVMRQGFQNEDLAAKLDSWWVYLDEVRDPGNLGTIMRLCEWFGVQGLLLSPGCVEIYNPKVIQASMGSILRVPAFTCPWEALSPRKDWPVIGAILEAPAYDRMTIKPVQGLLVFGNESNGISEGIRKHLDVAVSIPAAAGNRAESLNVASAAAILISHFTRN